MTPNKGMRRRNLKVRRRKMIRVIACAAIAVAFFGYCGFSMISSMTTLRQKNQELEDIKAATAAEKTENLELMRILADEDMKLYMEQVAIEELNYAYPNERRFYDSSRD